MIARDRERREEGNHYINCLAFVDCKPIQYYQALSHELTSVFNFINGATPRYNRNKTEKKKKITTSQTESTQLMDSST